MTPRPAPEPSPGPTADLTPEHLALAWRQMRRPAGWPSTLELALADPVCAQCLRGFAREMARSLGRPPFQRHAHRPAHTLPTAPVPPTPTAPPVRRAGTRNTFDARKAAANDHDE